VDHFSFANNDTFNMRYLINDTFWKPGRPIFFYTGNEGDIELFCNNTVSYYYYFRKKCFDDWDWKTDSFGSFFYLLEVLCYVAHPDDEKSKQRYLKYLLIL